MRASDKKAASEAERRAIEAQQLVNDFHRTFSTAEGKRVLAHLEALSSYHGAVFTPVKTAETEAGQVFAYDPITAALTDGARQLVIQIHKKLSVRPRGTSDTTTKVKVIKS